MHAQAPLVRTSRGARLRDVALERANMTIDGRETPLAPGMAAMAEIKTGRRRVISYLLSPLTRSTREAGRKR